MSRKIYFLGVLAGILLGSPTGWAQLLGGEVFLKGDYAEVGIGKNGAFGTQGSAPAGYHSRAGLAGAPIGFLADPARDGWSVGIPDYFGDYFLPGSPHEGWDIQLADGTWAQAWGGAIGTFTGGLTGGMVSYTAGPASAEGVWEGSLKGIRIRAVTRLRAKQLFFTTTVELTNTTSKTIYDFYYERTVDPDNEVMLSGPAGYTTDNKIEYKLPDESNRTLVGASGLHYKSYLGLASRDCRVRPYISGGNLLAPTDSLHILYRGTGLTSGIVKKDSLLRQDCGMGLIFKIDSLRTGERTVLSYAYILNHTDIDSAFEELKPVLSVNGAIVRSGDTVRLCTGETADLEITGGDSYSWKWSPKHGLSDTTGSRIKLTAEASTITYTAAATGGLCPTLPMTITVEAIPGPPEPVVLTPITYCQYELAAPLTATALPGFSLRYYATPGGTGYTSLTPKTSTAGTTIYYVSQVPETGCESKKARISVIVHPAPRLELLDFTSPSYCGGKDGRIRLKVDGILETYKLAYDKDGIPQAELTLTTDVSGILVIPGLGNGSYTAITLTNKYGCKSNTVFGPVNLNFPAPPGPAVNNNGPLCVNAEATLTSTIVPSATYNWTGPDGFTSTDRSPSFTTTPTSGGTYSLQVKVGECLYAPSTTNLLITPTPKNQQFNEVYALCQNTDLLIDILRDPGISYLWSGNGISLADQPLKISKVQFSDVGRYYLTASTDNGCTATDSLVVQVDKRPSFAIVSDTAVCAIDSASLFVNSDAPSIKWSPAAGLGRPEAFVTKAKPEQTTTYTATVASGNTCPDTSGKVTVRVIPTPIVKGYDTTVRMNIPYTVLPVFSEDVVKWIWQPTDSLSCGDCPAPVFNSSRDMTYVVKGVNKEGCVGSDEVTVRVFCDGANVTMPNAFTPNGDGTNDVFYVRGTGFTVKSFSIYNRLGQLVFSRENFLPNDPKSGWDGMMNGQQISDAAGFVYMLEAVCLNSKNAPLLIKGTVLMIK